MNKLALNMNEQPAAVVAERKEITVNTIGIAGRYLIDTGNALLISDSLAGREGPMQAAEPTHMLLAALSVCAIGSVEKASREQNISAPPATVKAELTRDTVDPTRFESILINVELRGVSQQVAQLLVDHFTSHCPIYNTVQRGGPIKVAVSVTP